jgi:hypothetical protein
MRALSNTELLRVWEQAFSQSSLQRALTLLAAARSDASRESLAGLSIGQRDAELFALREATFGEKFICVADCPQCDEKTELNFDAAEICPANQNKFCDELEMQIENRNVRFRLPTTADLLAAQSREQLFARCVLNGENHFSENVIQAVAEKISNADPLADIQLALNCSSCGHRWHAPFDIADFFWREINAAARNLLRNIHALASAYGWAESEILALSSVRRNFYLELVRE